MSQAYVTPRETKAIMGNVMCVQYLTFEPCRPYMEHRRSGGVRSSHCMYELMVNRDDGECPCIIDVFNSGVSINRASTSTLLKFSAQAFQIILAPSAFMSSLIEEGHTYLWMPAAVQEERGQLAARGRSLPSTPWLPLHWASQNLRSQRYDKYSGERLWMNWGEACVV